MAATLSFNMIRAITKSDTVDFPDGPCDAIYVGAVGDVVCIVNGLPETFAGVPAGSILPVRATRVNSTNTNASSMLWLKLI